MFESFQLQGAQHKERLAKLPRLACIVDGERVDVIVCLNGAQLAEVQERWPDGVDINEITKPGFESKLSRGERNWLARIARHLAARAMLRSQLLISGELK